MTKGTCARCGTTTSGGAYCRKCNGWAQQVAALIATADSDAKLLRLAEQHTVAEIGRIEGVSRQAVAGRLDKARARQAVRANMASTNTSRPTPPTTPCAKGHDRFDAFFRVRNGKPGWECRECNRERVRQRRRVAVAST